jgi:hypothetical protein
VSRLSRSLYARYISTLPLTTTCHGSKTCAEGSRSGSSLACNESAVSTCVSRVCSFKSVELLRWASDNGFKLSFHHYELFCEQATRSGNAAALKLLLEHDDCIKQLATAACDEAVREGRVSPCLRRAYDEAVSSRSVLGAVELLRKHGVPDYVTDYVSVYGTGPYHEEPNRLNRLYEFLKRLEKAGNAAARKEHTGVLLLLRSHLSTFCPGRELTYAAVKEDRFDDLKELYAKGYGVAPAAYDIAARSNRMDIVLWLREVGIEGNWGQRETLAAAAEGDAVKLQQLHESGCYVSRLCWAEAARGGHLYVFESLQSLGIINAETRHTGEVAARGAHLHLIQWLYEHHELELTSSIFEVVADSGSIEMLQWLRAIGCAWDSSAYGSAVRRDRLDILQWLRAEGCPLDDMAGGWGHPSIVTTAAARGNLAILRWLLEQGVLQLYASNIEAAVETGAVSTLELLHQFHCPMDERACLAAVQHGHLEVVLQWLRRHGCPWDQEVAERAARLGHLEMLQWMVQEAAPWNPKRCCSYAQKNQQTVVAKWIRKNHFNKGKKNKQEEKQSEPSTVAASSV